MSLFSYDAVVRGEGYPVVAGVDEAGRGPLAGPVVAAAVILEPDCTIEGLNDSKKLTERRRETLYYEILEKAKATAVVFISQQDIDRLNILGATLLAMEQAVEELSATPSLVLIDGNTLPDLKVPARAVLKGDSTSASIAAASILAKVSRDRYMVQLAEEYPEYEFQRHKGYPTKLHYEKLDEYGASPVHRESFLKKWRAKNPTKETPK